MKIKITTKFEAEFTCCYVSALPVVGSPLLMELENWQLHLCVHIYACYAFLGA